jgi:hypothetical protein
MEMPSAALGVELESDYDAHANVRDARLLHLRRHDLRRLLTFAGDGSRRASHRLLEARRAAVSAPALSGPAEESR